mmetsp:Transcript_72505/g.234602  ORF Transcript_72505/g.234602 Transcript_72505/m.234602 type:complete len:322 (-) Transcript_72505:1975-2940(-)
MVLADRCRPECSGVRWPLPGQPPQVLGRPVQQRPNLQVAVGHEHPEPAAPRLQVQSGHPRRGGPRDLGCNGQAVRRQVQGQLEVRLERPARRLWTGARSSLKWHHYDGNLLAPGPAREQQAPRLRWHHRDRALGAAWPAAGDVQQAGILTRHGGSCKKLPRCLLDLQQGRLCAVLVRTHWPKQHPILRGNAEQTGRGSRRWRCGPKWASCGSSARPLPAEGKSARREAGPRKFLQDDTRGAVEGLVDRKGAAHEKSFSVSRRCRRQAGECLWAEEGPQRPGHLRVLEVPPNCCNVHGCKAPLHDVGLLRREVAEVGLPHDR